MNREQFKQFEVFQGKVCWLNIKSVIVNSIDNNRLFDSISYDGWFKIYKVAYIHQVKHVNNMFYIHPEKDPDNKFMLRYPEFASALKEFKDEEDTIIYKLLSGI